MMTSIEERGLKCLSGKLLGLYTVVYRVHLRESLAGITRREKTVLVTAKEKHGLRGKE